MRTNEKGLALIKSFEGLKLEAYKCIAGVWTIGYGCTRGVKPGMKLKNEAEAEALLMAELAEFERAVTKLVKVAITPNQFAALVAWSYNVGVGAMQKSTLLKKLNAADYEGAANELLRWNKAGGKVVKGLTRRREAEKALFQS